MHPVRFKIEKVIQKVGGGSTEAELGKGQDSALDGRDIPHSVRQDQGNKDQHVLEPLMRPQGPPQRRNRTLFRLDNSHRLGDAHGALLQSRRGLDQNGGLSFFPDRQIARGIACVIESRFAVA